MISILAQALRNLLIVSSYYIVAFLLFILILFFTGKGNLFSEIALLNWDAEHYHWIKNNGYEGFRIAFFPFFPLIWKVSNLSVYGITMLNTALYILGFTILSTLLKINLKNTLLLLSIPSLIFMFVPYTEAIFYVSGTILLLGLNKKKDVWVCLGLLLCSLVRPVSIVFIPAIIITEILTNKNKHDSIKRSILYIFFSLLGLFTATFIQFYYTGEWLYFFEAQKGWGNHFRLPSLPLTSWAGGNIVRLDGSALLTGFIALLAIIKWFLNFLKENNLTIPKELLFSALYLVGICLLVLFFRGGSLFSLNRFVYATPFFTISLYYFLKRSSWNNKQIVYFFMAVTLFWLLFNSYVHILTFLKFGLFTMYLTIYLFMTSNKKFINNVTFITCLICNMFLQIYFYYRFLIGEWVG